MFRLRPAIFTPPPSPHTSPPPSSRSHSTLALQYTQADLGFQYSNTALVPNNIHPNNVPTSSEQQGASLRTAPYPATTQPMLGSTPAHTDTQTPASFQHTSTAQNPLAVHHHVRAPVQTHPSLAGPGVPPANSTTLQRSPPSVRTRLHDRAGQCASATGCTDADADADEETRTGTGEGTALGLGGGLREMWAEQAGRTLVGPGVPPSPPRLSHRAKGKWRETERSPRHDLRQLNKESSDFGGNDKGPTTRSKSRRYANVGATDGATEVPKEAKKEVGRSKQGTKRKRTADDDKGVATAAATATTSGKGKARKPTKTKSAEKDTNGAAKTTANMPQDASEAPEDTDSPRPAKRARLTVPRTPAKARVQTKLVIRLPPRTRAEHIVNASAIKLTVNENDGGAIEETDKEGGNGELHAGFEIPCQALTFGLADESFGSLETSARTNNGDDMSKATSDKNDEDIPIATRSDINPDDSISAQRRCRRTRKSSML
ncbi:hypothetical protein EYR36_009982 [Pleurotus pulmonarius]|nr:hypothetical protein EYR36_009982 [Pleurotus pulmonarius]KAF4593459.1 hypothetical protein EYR38_009174 [Pleurotus pulmonarius]